MPSGQQVVCPPSPGLREEALLHPVGSQCQPVLGREQRGGGGGDGEWHSQGLPACRQGCQGEGV